MLETILVVDGHESVRMLVVGILEDANFRVLSADSATAAINLAQATRGGIDLLITDLDTPQMSGPDLGQKLKKQRPDLHVMLMSGRDDGNLLVLNYGWAYIQKKFVPEKLVKMVLDVLYTPDRAQAGGQQFDTRMNVDHGSDPQIKKAGGAV